MLLLACYEYYHYKLKEFAQSVYCCNVIDKLAKTLYLVCKLLHQHHLYVCMYRQLRYWKNTALLHFSQPWPWQCNVDRLTEEKKT